MIIYFSTRRLTANNSAQNPYNSQENKGLSHSTDFNVFNNILLFSYIIIYYIRTAVTVGSVEYCGAVLSTLHKLGNT